MKARIFTLMLALFAIATTASANEKSMKLVGFAPTYATPNKPFTVSGRIVDEESGLPLEGKRIRIWFQTKENASSSIFCDDTTTDEKGFFELVVAKNLPTAVEKRFVEVEVFGDETYQPLTRVKPMVQFTDQPIVTYKIVNGTWADDTCAVRTVPVAKGTVIKDSDLPRREDNYIKGLDEYYSYGLNRWDVNPVGQTVNSNTTFTLTYFHYTITFDTGLGFVETEESHWWNTYGKEIIGGNYYKTIKSGDDNYAFDENDGKPWYTDPNDPTTVVDYETEITCDTTFYCKYRKATEIIDAISLTVTPKAGAAIPLGQYMPYDAEMAANDPDIVWYTLADFGLSAPNGADYEIGYAQWEGDLNEGDVFEEGKTYRVRLGVSCGDWSQSTVFFKGHATAQYDEDWNLINPEKCLALTINGKNGAGRIDNIQPTTVMVECEYTVPVATGISSIDNSQQTIDSWYLIDGRKLQGEPTQKGIYIHKGKKVKK